MNGQSFNYIIKEILGKGSFGEVYLAIKKGTNQKLAVKKINRKSIESSQNINTMLKEITILSMINHPNIVKFDSWVKSVNNYYIATEYINGGDLSDCLKKYKVKYNTPFPERIVQYLMKQILSALNYLHLNKIVHRDLKLDNIMVNFDNPKDKEDLNMLKAQIKIIDFGLSKHLNKNNLLNSAVGTLINMDPNIVNNYRKMLMNQKEDIKEYNEKCDIWSVGTVCYELAIGKKVFDVNSLDELWDKIIKGKYKIPKELSIEIISFLNSMLQFDANSRSSAKELLNHKFITKDPKDFSYITMEFAPKETKKNMKRSVWDSFKDEDKFINIKDKKPVKDGNNNININYNKINNNINTNNNVNYGFNRLKSSEIYWQEIDKWKQFYGFGGKSFYGQSMNSSDFNQVQNNNNNNNGLNKVKTFSDSQMNNSFDSDLLV